MRLYLVQHGEAHPEAVSPERELTPAGWEIVWMLRPELHAEPLAGACGREWA